MGWGLARIFGLVFFSFVVYAQDCASVLSEVEKSPWYRVKTLTRGDQTVVLVGETHVKSKHAALLGEKLLEPFENIAIEGVTSNQYFGKNILKASVKFIHTLVKVFSFGYLRGGSTTYKVSELKEKNIIGLEKNHQPKWNDQLLSIGVQSCAALLGVELTHGVYQCVFQDPDRFQPFFGYLRLGLMGLSAFGVVVGALTQTRDQAMADSIEKFFAKSDNKVLLVLTGMLHTGRIANVLRTQKGFK